MAIATLCPGCKSLVRLPEELAGKQVRCQKCDQRFVVPGVPARPSAPATTSRPAPNPVLPPMPAPAPAGALPPIEPLPMTLLTDTPSDAPEAARPRVASELPAPEPRSRPRRRRPPAEPRRPTSVAALVCLTLVPLALFGALTVATVMYVTYLAANSRAQAPAPFAVGGPGMQVKVGQAAAPGKLVVIRAQLVNGSYQDNANVLIPTDGRDPLRNFPAKAYDVRLENGQTYEIDMESGELDSYLRLTDKNGRELQHDDDGGNDKNARIRFQAPATDDYRIYVSDFNGNLGRYAFSITREVPGQQQPRKLVPIAVTLDANGAFRTSTALVAGDGFEPEQNHPCKLYEVRFEQGSTYQIDMVGADGRFDSYLSLANADGTILIEDDDSGGGLNSRITFLAPVTATYRIYASELSGNVGRFTLSIRRIGQK